MSIKITSIELKDYRAFYGDGYTIDIPDGKNLIIYGENGSGKSSIYNALCDFFKSASNTSLPLAKHIKAADAPNEHYVKITFTDFDENPPESIPFEFSNLRTDTDQAEGNFISQTYTLKSFLSYKQLLKTYLFESTNHFEVHFFKLIVEELIGNINNAYTNNPIVQDWKDLLENPRDTELATQIEKGVNEILTGIIYPDKKNENIPGINTYLNSFLEYFHQDLKVQLKPCSVKTDENTINASVSLDIEFFGESLKNHLEILNEARLSALALSIYFSAIRKSVASQLKYKILFLDDIFVGLDLSNRIPLLNILLKEFSDYQIFVTTYDRHWFETAQRYLYGLDPEKWFFSELFQTPFEFGGYKSMKPIIIQSESTFSKGIYYLHHDSKPDFPAAANYFRKYSEELFTANFFRHEIRNSEDDSLIESHKLGKLVAKLLKFVRRLNYNDTLLVQLQSYLPTLLHPLSHFNLSAPVYKGELLKIQTLLHEIELFINDIKNNCKLLFPTNRKFNLIFNISPAEKGVYEIFTNEPIYIQKQTNGTLKLSDSACHAKKTYLVKDSMSIPGKNFKSDDISVQYFSLEDAYTRIFQFIAAQSKYSHIQREADYINAFEICNDSEWLPLSQFLIIS